MDEILNKLEKVKSKLNREEKEKARLEGAYDTKMESLNTLHLPTVDMAKEQVEDLIKKKTVLMKRLDKLVSNFDKKYPELMEN